MHTALLPSGRLAWLTLRPAPAPAAEVNRLARAAFRSDAQHEVYTRTTARQIERLRRLVMTGAKKISQAQVRSDAKVRKAILAGDGKLNREVSTQAAKFAMDLRRQRDAAVRRADDQSWRALWNFAVVISTFPLFAAYGDRRSPAGLNNFALMLSLAVWLVGDEISDFLTGEKRIAGGILEGIDVWSYAAPFANLLAGYWLLHGSQHEPFVAGLTSGFERTSSVRPPASKTSVDVYTAIVNVADKYIGPNDAYDFETFSNVPAVATLRTATVNPAFNPVNIGLMSVAVVKGNLRIDLTVTSPFDPNIPVVDEPILRSIEAAWLVDARSPAR
ncbi:MAG: hypothetical protein IPK82_40270 [Polyangiaceae bacterium]|nr:hypothetical protein [Polyangiaceae bacterium]